MADARPALPRDCTSFDEFWPSDLGQHASATNRALHIVGTAGALLLAVLAVAWRQPAFLLLVPLLRYGPGWIGHL